MVYIVYLYAASIPVKIKLWLQERKIERGREWEKERERKREKKNRHQPMKKEDQKNHNVDRNVLKRELETSAAFLPAFFLRKRIKKHEGYIYLC